MKITKRNGNITMYDDEKVVKSILKANGDTKENMTEAAAADIAAVVFARLTAENEIISTKEIRDCVMAVLAENGYVQTANAYEEYKK